MTTTQGTCTAKPAKSLVTCSIGTIASGASVTVVITVKPTGPERLQHGDRHCEIAMRPDHSEQHGHDDDDGHQLTPTLS